MDIIGDMSICVTTAEFVILGDLRVIFKDPVVAMT